MAHDQTTIVSAPGKVLIAGGYVVLDPAFPGLVISTTSRFYTVIQQSSSSANSPAHQQSIRVCAPQFIDAVWDYTIHDASNGSVRVEQSKTSFDNPKAGRNPFVEYAVLYAVRLACEATSVSQVLTLIGTGMDISVVADNDFYSQRETNTSKAPSSSELRALPPFHQQKCAIRDVHKTGLGSSAAMTTALVAALLVHLQVLHPDVASGHRIGDEALALLHNTAQLAHCAAQGKIGSGFDVSAAVWGSQLYRRFDKQAIQAVLDAGDSISVQGASSSASTKRQQIELAPFIDPRNPYWHPSPLSGGAQTGKTNPTAVEGLAVSGNGDADSIARPAPLELPPFVEMILADVDAGSNTPSMVGKIQQWQKANPEWAKQTYAVLGSANQTLADALLALRLAHAQDSQAYEAAVTFALKHFSKDWDALLKQQPSATLSLLIEVRNAMRSIQGGMRALGRQAGVPVEPDEMGNVIKATIDGAHGVIGGGVPGAGGYDALFVLFLQLQPHTHTQGQEQSERSAADQEIERVWSQWNALSVGPLLSRAGGAANVATSVSQVQQALLTQGVPHIPALTNTRSGGVQVHANIANVKGLQEAIS